MDRFEMVENVYASALVEGVGYGYGPKDEDGSFLVLIAKGETADDLLQVVGGLTAR